MTTAMRTGVAHGSVFRKSRFYQTEASSFLGHRPLGFVCCSLVLYIGLLLVFPPQTLAGIA